MTGPTDQIPASSPRPWEAGLAAAVFLAVVAATPAGADPPSDIAAAQTAAAIENTAIAFYARVAALPIVAGLPSPAGTTLSTFVTRTVQHHTDHLTAFNAAAVRLGGKAQTGVDETFMSAVVAPALATLASAQDAVAFAAKLELIAAETYSAQVAAVSDRQLRSSLASIAGVECQHQAVLLAVAALLEAATPDAITFPLRPDQVPATVPSGSSPAAFLRTDQARAPTEAVVR